MLQSWHNSPRLPSLIPYSVFPMNSCPSLVSLSTEPLYWKPSTDYNTKNEILSISKALIDLKVDFLPCHSYTSVFFQLPRYCIWCIHGPILVDFHPGALRFCCLLNGVWMKTQCSKFRNWSEVFFQTETRVNSCWKLYWQAYTCNLWYFLSRCWAELETFVNKSFCCLLKGSFFFFPTRKGIRTIGA